MFEEKKIETLRKRIEKVEEENKMLRATNKELSDRLNHMDAIVQAAEDCIEVNKRIKREFGLAKTQYETAFKEMMLLKKEYKEKMDKVLKSV